MSNLTACSDSSQGLANDDVLLREEMQRLAAEQAELLGTNTQEIAPDDNDLAGLRAENAELREQLEEFDKAWGERQREYENLLEEKSEVIRSLHVKIQQLQEGGTTPEGSDPQDLSLVRRQLEEDRRQIEQDEEALMVQMRQMEMSMSKERAELARQRTELQRLQADLNREIENAARDGSMRDRLQALRKPYEQHAVAADTTAVSSPTPPPKKQSSGLLRRLFG